MSASFHIVGCLIASRPVADLVSHVSAQALEQHAEILAHGDREAMFVKFDATDAQLIVLACRAVLMQEPAVLRFGFASGIRERSVAEGGEPRVSERSLAQASGLASGARDGEVLVSSQLGSLMQIAHINVGLPMRPTRVNLSDGRQAAAYSIDWRSRPTVSDPTRI